MSIRSTKRILSLLILIALCSLHITGSSLFAEEEREGVGISPTKLTLDADPGESLEGQFIVLNPGTKPVDYRLYVKDFSIRNEEYEKDFEPAPGAISPVDWFQVPGDVMTLAPNEQKTLTYNIQVPRGAVPRGYYAVIFAETVASQPDTTGVTRLKRVGSLVYLTVNGGSVKKGDVVGFEAAGFQQSRPVKSSLRIRNEGNIHFAANSNLRLKDIFGRTVAKTELTSTILPATIRRLNLELKPNQPFGLYKIEGDVKFLGNTTRLGEKWILVGSPFWFILWTVIIVGWIVVLIRWIKRRANRKKIKR